MAETITTITHNNNPQINSSFFSQKTGIYTSKNPKIQLPQNPFLDIVSHIFSYPNNNNKSLLIDALTGYSIPYSSLFSLIKSMAFELNKMGFSQYDVGLILLPNSIYFPIIFLSVLYLGGIVTPMNPFSSFNEIKKQVNCVHVKFAFCNSENAKKLQSLGLKVIEIPENVIFEEKNKDFPEFSRLIFGKNNGDINLILRNKIKQDDIATIMYSSGTSGTSKGVILTHKNLISMVELFVRFEASQYKNIINHENIYLGVLPMFHIYGLALYCFGLFSLGTSIVVMKRFDINKVEKIIEKYKVTHLPIVPPVLLALTKKVKGIGFSGSGFRSLKQVSCGAAPTASKVITDFLQSFPGVDFIQGYGLTESTAVGTRGFNVVGQAPKYNSVGLLAPNMEAKIVNWSKGLAMPPGNSGELLLRGPGVMKGYLNNREATRQTIDEDGWLHTGDVAYFDNDGYLYIIDRLKDIIKYKGFQIAPADLETILMEHPEIIDVAVTGSPHEEAGEIPVAFVVKRPGSLLSRDEVINYVANLVAPYKKVREVVFMTSIPKSAAGKMLKRHLKNMQPSRL